MKKIEFFEFELKKQAEERKMLIENEEGLFNKLNKPTDFKTKKKIQRLDTQKTAANERPVTNCSRPQGQGQLSADKNTRRQE